MVSSDEFGLANARARRLRATVPRATDAYYDGRTGRIVVNLTSNIGVVFSPQQAEGLERASPSQLQKIEITPSGYGIHFPKLDADLYLPALLEGFLGSRRWMASRLGRAGGKVRSAAKKSASRQNGKLGGRPRKRAAG